MDADRAEMVRRASAMHDVGKVTIPDAILLHGGASPPSSGPSWRPIDRRRADPRGLAVARSSDAEAIALTHHERGTARVTARARRRGHPLEGRIVAVATSTTR
jgi:putative two-component system response regulator